MADPIAGWHATVYTGLTEPLLLCGVPQTFFGLNAIVTMTVTLLWWPGLLIGLMLYGVVRLGTYCDPQFFDVLVAHVRYKKHYEA